MAVPWTEIEQAGFNAAVAAMQRGSERIAARAKELAPVRKVFGQYEKPYKVRLKTISEIRADKNLRQQLGLGPESPYIHPPLIVARRAPQNLRARRLLPAVDKYTGRRVPNLSRLPDEQVERMDRRGLHELHTLRAEHEGSVGGRLRAEIHAEAVRIDGRHIRGRVVSPTPYALYQEMGTRHNPAHPYLRPAGHQGRERLRQDIGRSVAAAAKPLFRGRLDVVVKFRAR